MAIYAFAVGNGYQQPAAINGVQAARFIAERGRGARWFALCDSCFWSATVFRDVAVCPVCSYKLSLLPLAEDEGYSIKMTPRSGLELVFSKNRA